MPLKSTRPFQTFGTSDGPIGNPVIESLPVVCLSAVWLLVWLLGLPFILRKRPMSIRRETSAGNEARVTP